MRIDASCTVGTIPGNFLGNLIYGTQAIHLFTDKECACVPNEGASHRFRLNTRKMDVEAFLELVEERYGAKKGCSEFVEHVRSKLH